MELKPCEVISNIETFFVIRVLVQTGGVNRNYALSMTLCVHTAILSIKTVCWARDIQVPEKSYNIRPWSYIRDFFPVYKTMVL